MTAIVGLVTPADVSSPSVQAFLDEGTRLVWANNAIVRIYSPANAQAAHDDVHANGGVLVVGGEKTAFALQAITPPSDGIPIIVAFAGEAPGNQASNMTGFIGDCGAVAHNHLHGLKTHGHNGQDVKVLLDSDQINNTNTANTVTQRILNKLLQFDGNITQLGKTVANIQGLTAAELSTGGFMLIPNAFFFEYASVIAGAVDNSNQVMMAYYPEFEYWRHQQNKGKANVSGYNVPLTYRLAASWVNNLLSGYWNLGSMPQQFADAIPEPYDV
jgi:hypothetical protein